MRILTRALAALALATLALATTASAAADKPLVMESGKVKQLPSSTTIQLNASGTGAASINIPHGAAPTSPNNGDCWTTTGGLFCRINGASIGPYGTGSGSAITSKDEGSTLTSATTSVDFVGSGVTATNTGGAVTVTIAGGGGTTTNALTITNTGGASAGATFDGSAAKTIDYSTVGAAKTGAITGSGLTQATGKLLGRSTASTGAIEEISVGTGLSLSSGTLSASGSAGALTLISEVVTSGSQANVTFSSISSSYRDLVLVVRGRGTASAGAVTVRAQFNTDTGSNYQHEQLRYAGTANSIGQTTGESAITMEEIPAGTATANYAGWVEARIYDYRGTTFYKVVGGRVGGHLAASANTNEINMFSAQWNSTSAINEVKVLLSSGNFVDGSVVSLYGVM
jgi:hypothetical protein